MMDRKTRIGIARGVWAAIAGVIVAFVITPIVGYLLSPNVLDSLNPADLERGMIESSQKVKFFYQVLAMVFYGGLAFALCGALCSALVWTKWLTREPEVGVASH